jgi:hypothetical protein
MDKFFQFPHEKVSQGREADFNDYETMSVQQSSSYTPSTPSNFSSAPSEYKQFNESRDEFDKVVRSSQDMDERLKVHLERNESLINRVFPSKMQKLVSQKDRLMVGTALDFRLNLLKMNNEFRLEATRDRLDAYLKAYKAENRLQLTKFMIAKVNELYSVVKQEEMFGIREIEQMHHQAQTITVSSMRAKYIQRVEAREEGYLNVIHQLITHFENIINEHLTKRSLT